MSIFIDVQSAHKAFYCCSKKRQFCLDSKAFQLVRNVLRVCATVLPQSGSLSPALNFNHCNVPVHKLPRHAHAETRTCVAFGQESLDSMGGRKEAALYRGNIPAELAQWPCLSPRSASVGAVSTSSKAASSGSFEAPVRRTNSRQLKSQSNPDMSMSLYIVCVCVCMCMCVCV